jgi:hypothetical protein
MAKTREAAVAVIGIDIGKYSNTVPVVGFADDTGHLPSPVALGYEHRPLVRCRNVR